jgi:hypothetical protein
MRMLKASLLLTILFALPAQAQNDMKTLQAADAALKSGLTLALDVTVAANPFDPAQGKETRTGRLTVRNREWAFESVSHFENPPRYRERGTPGLQPYDFDSAGNLITWRTQRHTIVANATQEDAVVVWRKQVINSSGGTVREGEETQRQRYKPGSGDSFPELDRILMAIGHGYARQLDAASATSGQRVQAKGRHGGRNGQWTLTFDGTNRGLVREATFVAQGSNTPSVRVTVEGAVDAGTTVVGKRGTVQWLTDGTVTNELTVQVNTARTAFDADLFSAALKRATAPLPAGSETIDFRKTPTTRSFTPDSPLRDCDTASGTQECCSAQHCGGKVLNNRDRHNCKNSGGKSWHDAEGACFSPP